MRSFLRLRVSVAVSFVVMLLSVIAAKAQPSFSSTPLTTATVGTPYTYAISATDPSNTPLTFSSITKPAWLTLNTNGQSTATAFGGTISQNTGAVAGDAAGNIYTNGVNSTVIYKMSPDGTTVPWFTRQGGNVYSMAVYNNELYIAYYSSALTNQVSCIRKINLASPTGETLVYTNALASSFTCITFYNNFLYLGCFGESKVMKMTPTGGSPTTLFTQSGVWGIGFNNANGMAYVVGPNIGFFSYNGSATTLISGESGLYDTKVDANGYVYTGGYGAVKKYAPNLASNVTVFSFGSYALGLTITPTGALVFGNWDGTNIYRLQTGASLTGTPASGDIGVHNVTVRVSNGSATADQTFTVSVTGPPTIGAMSNVTKTYGDAAFAITNPTSTSPGGFSYASNAPSVISVSGSTLTVVGAGTATITATQAASGLYTSGTRTFTVTVNKLAPVVTSFPALTKQLTSGSFTLTAPTSTSGSAFTYASSNPSAATISGSVVNLVGVGSTTITATQATNANYSAGTITAVLTVLNNPATGLNFDGADDYVSLPSPQLANLNTFTFEAWVKPVGTTGNAIYAEGLTSALEPMFSIIQNQNASTGFEIVLRNSASTGLVVSTTTGNIPLNQWSHVAFVRTSATQAQLYINGVLTDNFTFADPGNISVNVANIGVRQRTYSEEFFNGNIDEVRFWNKALCAAQIVNNMNGEISAPQSGLTAYYKFNQGFVGANNSSVTTLSDAGGSNLTGALHNFALNNATSNWTDGTVTGTAPAYVIPTGTISGSAGICVNATASLSTTLTGGTWNSGNSTVANVNASGVVTGVSAGTSVITYSTSCGSLASFTVTVSVVPTPTIGVTGSLTVCPGQSTLLTASNFGNALLLNGNNYSQSTNAALPQGNTARTIEAWIKCPSNAAGVVANWGQIVTNQRSGLLISGGRIYFVGENNDQVGNIAINDNTWHHVAFTFDGSTVRLYVDGVLDIAVAKTLNTTGTTLRLGQRAVGDGGNELFIGAMDEVKIWNVARTQAQLQTARYNEIDGNTQGLVAYYKFNQTSGTSIPDASVNNVTSTLISTGTWIASGNPSNSSYLWTPGNATTQSLTVTSSGTYSVTATNPASCSATSNPVTFTVTPLPAVAAITGTNAVCVGSTTQLNNTTPGGVWSSNLGSIASVDNTGKVTGVSTGIATISYNVTNACGTTTATYAVTVNTLPVATISALGATTFCQNGSVTLKSTGSSLGNALSFNGSSQYVNVSTTAAISNLGLKGYTLEAWVYPTDVNDVKSVLRKTGDYNLYIINGSVAAEVWPQGTSNASFVKILPTGSNVIPVNAWTHIAATWNAATQTGILYINGVVVPSTVSATTISGSEPLLIGRSSVYGQPFAGKMDELRMWDTVRTATQVANNRNTFIAGNSPHLVAYYKFDEGTGTSTADASGAGNTGSLVNSPQWVIPSDVPVTYSNYLWTPGGATTSTINATASGNYTLQVSDVNGCTATSTPIAVTVNPLPTATTVKTDVSCAGGNTGAITVTAANGTAPYQYSKNGGTNYQASNVFSNLIAGTYNIVVKSATSCTSTVTVVAVGTTPDVTAPVPNAASLPTVTGQCSATVVTVPTATDNCSGTINGTTTDPLLYTVQGTFTITWKFTDAANNSSTQTQTVIVKDDTPPVITCAPDQTVVNDAGQCAAQIVVISPTVIDNCSGAAGNNGLIFDGLNDYVSIGNQLATNSSYTKEAWLYLLSTNAAGNIISSDDCPFWLEENKLAASNGFQHGGITLRDPNTFPTFQWTHVAVTYDAATTTMKIYKNGIVIATNTAAPGYLNGNFNLGMWGGANNLNSVMDEVRIWNVARTSAQINANMNIALTGAPTNLVSRYSFDHGIPNGSNAGVTTATNTQGNTAFNGILFNFALTGTASNWVTGAPALAGLVLNNSFNNTSNASGLYNVGTTNVVWTATDAAGNVSTCTQVITVTAPDINLTGNGTTIPTGDVTPSTSDNTDFGGTTPGVGVTKTYAIQNTGTSPLTVNAINIGGANAANFTRNGITLPVVIAAGSNATFNVTFNTTAVGAKNATVTVNSNDCDEASYAFAVTGLITCVPPSFANGDAYIQHNTSATTCDTTITYGLSVNGTTPVITYTFTGATTGTGSGTGSGKTFNTGVTHVAVNATNTCGTVSTNFDVTVVDNVKPTPVTKNITVYLGANGQATVTAAQLDNGSYDNCGPVTVSVNSTGYVCGVAAEGSSVFLQAPNGALFNGVTFASYGSPGGSCGNFTLGSCNATGSMAIVSNILIGNNSGTIFANNGVFGDPCNGTVKSIAVQATYATTGASSNTFDCSKLGANNVTFVVNDAAGNAQSAVAIVTVVDSTRPVVNTRNLTLCLDASGNASITPAMINNGSTDNCAIASITLDKLTFNGSDVGTNTVTLSVTDVNGNVGTRTATVTINALPVAYNVNGGGAYCVGSAGVPVGLDNSQTGVNYQLKRNGTNVGSVTAGTGSTLNFGIQTAAGTYTVSAVNASTSCGSEMGGSVTVVVNALPAITVAPAATTICAGGAVTLTASQNVTTTRTYNVPLADLLNVTNQCSSVSYYGGTNQGFKWTDLGTGTVTNVNIRFATGVECSNISHTTFLNNVGGTSFTAPVNCDCGVLASGNIITLNFGSTGYVVGGLNTFRVGNNSTFGFAQTASLSNYFAIVTVTYNGGGSANVNNWSWAPGGQTTASINVTPASTTMYTVTATDVNGCSNTASSTLTVNPLPVQFIVTGGGIACGSGVPVGLDGSQNGVRYQLKNGAANAGSPVNGTGSAITFGNQASAGNYTVIATNITTSCTNQMFGNAGITTGTAPVFANTNSAVQAFTTSATCNATVNYALSASGLPGVNVSYVFAGATTGSGAGTGNGSVFNKGVTNVAVTASNGCGTVVYNFIVTVIDNVVPTITAPSAIAVNNDAGACGAAINLGTPVTADNCGVASVTNNAASFITDGLYPVGTTVVTWTVTDNSGLTATATQVITVTDNEKPTITAPVGINVNNDASKCGAAVNVAAPVSADNCGVASTMGVRSDGLALNADYPVGTTTITWTVTDLHNNTQTATQTVVVTDNEKPVITAPAAINVNNDAAKCGAQVNVTPVISADNCGVATTTGVRSDGLALAADYAVGTTTITWMVTDIHGNSQAATQTVVVTDTEKPVILNLPASRTINALNLNCANVVTWVKPTASDNCGVASIVSNDAFYEVAGYTLLPVGVNTITYTATDIHGNTTTASFTITVVDNQPPVITGCPSNITINAANNRCDQVVNWNPPTASDNCPGVSLSTNHISGETFQLGTTTVIYTATDHAGLVTTCSFNVTVVDAQKPVLSGVPANVTVECNAVPVAATVTATDNCATSVAVVYNETRTNGNCPSNYILTRTWTATDAANNIATGTQVITVQDTQAPVLSAAPASVTVECNAVPNAAILTATDNCSTPAVTYAELRTNGNCPSNYILTRTWTATDACGNTASKTQTITVQDTQAPVLSAAPANVTVECNEVPAAAILTVTDNCDAPVVLYNEIRTNGNSPSNYTLIRTWTATDACGNTSAKTQTIIVQDTQAPVISAAPANITVECNAVPVAAVLTATDNCDAPIVVYNETRTNGNCPSNYILTRTWTSTDASGNTAGKTQTITVQDTQAPVLSAAPASVTVECDAVPVAAVLTATDNCDAPVVVYNESRTNGNSPSNYTLTRTWTATDACGNTSSKTQTITVQDTQAPVISASPTDVTVECNAVPVAAVLTATDNCDTPAVTYAEVRTNGNCPSNYILTRTWTSTDASGNTSSKTQVITVQDTQAPVLSVAPASVTVECDAVPVAAILTATDNCDAPVVVYNESRTNGNSPSNYTLTRTWTATDACGNTSSKTQTITVQDTQAPVISAAPADITVECNAVPAAAILTATDNCDTPVVIYNEARTNGNCPSNYILTRTWTSTDASGNTSSKTQTITVQDTQAPVLSAAPADVTVECDAVPTAATLTATDNCDTPTVTYAEVRTNGNCPSNYTLTRTWTAVDACGNTSSKTQTITVQDTQAPVLSAAPADVTVECDAVPAAATLTATDNCDTPTVTYAEVRTNGNCPSNYTLTRTWTAVDACGNTSSKTQTITVQDTQAPVLSAAPADVTVECDAVPAAATLTATDNCDTPTVTYAEVRTNGNCPSSYALTRTWTAVDACGNTSSKTQTITVQDTQAPVLSAAPADVTVECNAVPAAATLTATDNCDAPTVTYAELRTNGNCPSNYILTRTWTAVDACGNTSSKTQTITVQDTQAPVLSAAPADVTVECDAVPAAAILTATDNCDAPVVVYHELRTNGNSPSNYTLTRTWTVTDACGNTSSAAQTITVRDTKKPVLSAAPANVTVECNAVPAAATLTATDNCDATPTVTYNETRTNGNCPGNYTLTRTWTATDASGNTCSKTQTITVQDTQKPVLSAAPASVTVACNAVPAAAILTATDNCDAPAVTYSEVRTNGSSPFNYTLSRTWTATDACGNSCSKTQVITVRDTQAPVPTIAVLPTLTGDCSVTASAPTAQDNCAGLVTATTVNPVSYTAQGVYTITWSYNDGQGNTSTQTQRVVVKDQSGPIANAGALPTVTGQCSAVVTTKPTATDACSGVTAPGTTTDPLSYSAQGTYTIHWTYTDNFGNKTYQDQTVIVKDNIAPVPNLASLPTIEGQCSVNITMVNSTHCTDNCYCCRNVCHCRSSACNCNQWGEWLSNIFAYFFGNGNTGDDNHGCDHDEEVDDVNNLKMQAPTATDNCKGTIVGTTTDPLSYSTQGTYTIHWSFNDGNGNISIQNQTVTVADVEAPVPNAYSLPTVYGTCSATVTAKPTAKDNCKGTITGTTTDPLTYAGNGTYVIHWTFNDGNGNTSAQNQTVVINDNTKPTLTEPNDITISCSSSTLPAVTGNATASDNCGTPTITYTDATNGNKITRTWKATDAAGNYTTDVQVITISDNTKPVITAPNSVTVNCGTLTLPSATGTATATDNCSTATVTYSDNVNGYVTTRTWKATDAAGNYSTATQTITTVDNVKPTISTPNNVTVNCGSSTHPSATGTATGADACSSVTISYSDAATGSVITRTWKATDASGNFITATQTITIVDNTKPVISDVNDITISCSQSSTPAGCNSVATATDNCSTPTVTYSDVTAGNKITRTWKATDAAGNFATSTQVITIVDNTKPVLTEPNDITINCGASTLPAVTGNATATDNCSTPAITYSDATNGNVITRTWKATDASGNYVTDVQLITIGSSFSAALTSVPTNNTYTGGVNTNLYLGFGAQSTTLQMCNLPSSGAPYSYAWSGTASNKLNSTTTASPVFTPATFGYYSFTVVVTNKYGCTSSAYISICVTDVRVPGTSGAKVYVCHTPGGKNKTPQTLQVAISQVSSHIGSSSCGSNGDDRLGSCDESPCNTTVTNSTIVSNSTTVTKEGSETVATTEEDLKVTVMPNPTTTFFTLKLESKYETPVSMRVMDARGRVIDAKSKIGANSTIQIGHNYSSGTYYAELIQGTKRKVVQMIKGRG
jgi:hypothetical protein